MEKWELANRSFLTVAGFLAERMSWRRRTQHGQTLVEYSLILAFVATMVIAISVLIGGTNGLIDDIDNELSSALGL